MNATRWNALPADIKKAFKDASGRDWWGEVGKIWRATDDFGIGLAVKSGNTHITLTEAETEAFRKAVAPVVERWVGEVAGKGIDGNAMVTKARKLIAENGS